MVEQQPQYWAELDGFFASRRQTKALEPADVHPESDLEVDAEGESFWEQLPTGKTTGAVHKLYAIWEAQGCDGAMSNSGLLPFEVAQWDSVKSHMEEQYQRDFEAAAAEIWARHDASGWMDRWKEDLQEKTGRNFVRALESLKPLEMRQTFKAPAIQSTTNSKHANELASHMPDGAKGLATGLQVAPNMGPLPTTHQLVFPMAQGTRVICFKLVDYHHARHRGWVVQVQCPLCNDLIHQRLDEVEQGQELPAARAHLQRTIGNKRPPFRLATAATSATRTESSCSGAYHNWCRILQREGHDPQSHDHQVRYTKGREICVPLYSDAFQWGYESWRNEDVPVLDICSYFSVPRTQKAKEAGLPTTPVKAETSTAGVATQVCSPASPSTPKWALTPDASSPSPATAPPGAVSSPAKPNFRGGAVSSPAKPNFRNMHLSPTKVQDLKLWQHVSPTPYCSCAQRRYKGDGVYPVVKVHEVDCECYIDPNGGWPAQMHWELERLPKRIQPK